MSLVSVQNLDVQYSGARALHDVSMEINESEIVTLIGPNGAGKSTLVRVIIGVIAPSRGSITRAPNLRMGYVPQKLDATSSMPMDVGRFLKTKGRVDAEGRKRILQIFGVDEMKSKPLSSLSGGEMRRVLMTHALLDEPNLLILDEPTAGLDVRSTAQFYELIEDLRNREKMAILLVSHDLNVVMKASDRVICLNGHICCEGAPMDVSKAPEYARLIGVPEPVTIYEHHHDHAHDH